MRSDRAASLYFFQPVTRLLGRNTRAIPILMYHRVPQIDSCTTHPYYCTSTAVKIFEQQVRFLRQEGYRSVSVKEAFGCVQTAEPGEKLVGITFDDGYQDFYANAFPILNRYGYSATVFLPTAYIGHVSRQFKGAECLTWSQIRELRKAGVEFGSHTVTHPQLRDTSEEQMRVEVRRSKQEIQEQMGERVDTFAYPYAFPEADLPFIATLRGALQDSGYQSGVTTIIGRVGLSTSPLFMNRLPVNSHDDLRFFQAKLEGAYDWLHAVQYAMKLSSAGTERYRRIAQLV
jgi:peptidoglycan/xylan/chitin deacetylase (PgdA/CDA1 family)